MTTVQERRLKSTEYRSQGSAKKVLCVCSMGLLRSPTAAIILHNLYGHNTRSAGLSNTALIKLDSILLHWADEIVVFTKYHETKINENIKNMPKPVKNLMIDDVFKYMQSELITEIKAKYKND